MSCKCGSNVILTVSAKCYDMCTISYGDNEETSYVPANIGLGEDPYHVNFEYCLQCGTIQGEFPIQLPVQFRPKLVEPKPVEIKLGDLIQEFYDLVMANTSRQITMPKLSLILARMHRGDAEILSDVYHKFEELRTVYPNWPEFDDTIEWVKQNYRNVVIQPLVKKSY